MLSNYKQEILQNISIFNQEGMPSNKRVDRTPRKRCQIIMLRESGLSCAEIARQVGGSVTTSGVQTLSLKYQETHLIENKAGVSQKIRTTSVDDRRTKRLCLQDIKTSLAATKRYLNNASVYVSSRQTSAGLWAGR